MDKPMTRETVINGIICAVAELPDRTSPEPDMMLVSVSELAFIVGERFDALFTRVEELTAAVEERDELKLRVKREADDRLTAERHALRTAELLNEAREQLAALGERSERVEWAIITPSGYVHTMSPEPTVYPDGWTKVSRTITVFTPPWEPAPEPRR